MNPMTGLLKIFVCPKATLRVMAILLPIFFTGKAGFVILKKAAILLTVKPKMAKVTSRRAAKTICFIIMTLYIVPQSWNGTK
jgi:hypothetical protein